MRTLLSVFFFLAVAVFCFTAIYALQITTKRHNHSTAYKILCLGTIISAVYYFMPFYYSYFASSSYIAMVKCFFLSIHHAIRLFVVDVSYDELRAFAAQFGLLGSFYTGFGIALFLIAPFLTFTFIVSFLQETFAVILVWFSPCKEYYIFSEVNLQSLYLAEDIRKKYPRINIVFLGVDRENKSEYEKIKTCTRHIHPVLLSTDCVQMNHLMVRYKRSAKFFMISENEEENTAAVIGILEDTPRIGEREIYVRLSQNDCLLDNLPQYENTQVFRIEHIYSLVVHNLEEHGVRLFENTTRDASGNQVISILVVGLGRTGSELVKSLAWFTQVEGYTTRIHAFEQNPVTIEKFKHRCPGLFGEDAADRHCQIIIHPNMIFGTPAFDRELRLLEDVGFVYVALGGDNLNANAARDIRRTFAAAGKHPPIQAIFRNDEAGKLISASKNYRGMSYDIEFIGSYREIYCLEFITDAHNKEAIIRENLKWHSEERSRDNLAHEEQYRMSKSWVVHQKLLDRLRIPEEKRVESEHRRWVNMLFSEGYVYGPKRDDIAKHHPLLVSYEQLPEKWRL